MPIVLSPPKPARPGGKPRGPASSLSAWRAAGHASAGTRRERLGRRPPSERELLFFTTRLALLLEMGSSLNRSLAAIGAQIGDAEMAHITRSIQNDVEAGTPLSAALARHPELFDHVFVSMVRAGESAGMLPAMLNRQAELLRRRRRFRAALRGSLSYPVFLLALSGLVVAFMLVFIYPRFAGLFTGLGAPLPWTTRALLAAGVALRQNAVWCGAGSLALGLAMRWAAGTRRGRSAAEHLQLHFPGLGGVMRQVYTGRLLLNLGTLLASRVPLLEAVSITEGLLPRGPYAAFFAELRASIEGGRGLAAAFAGSGLFPPTVQEMIQTGETSSGLDRIMLRLADFYEDEIQERIRVFLQVLEPVLLVLMGAVVAGISLSLIVPILKLSGGIR